MRLEGGFLARAPTDKEIDDSLKSDTEGEGENEEEEPKDSVDELEPKAFSLAEAAKAAGESGDEERRIQSIFQNEFFGMSLRDEALERQRQVPVLEGALRLGLHAKSLERAEELSKMYPIDEETGLRWLDVPLDGSIYDAGVEMADEILERIRVNP